jgi:hypothetical protein
MFRLSRSIFHSELAILIKNWLALGMQGGRVAGRMLDLALL